MFENISISFTGGYAVAVTLALIYALMCLVESIINILIEDKNPLATYWQEMYNREYEQCDWYSKECERLQAENQKGL